VYSWQKSLKQKENRLKQDKSEGTRFAFVTFHKTNKIIEEEEEPGKKKKSQKSTLRRHIAWRAVSRIE